MTALGTREQPPVRDVRIGWIAPSLCHSRFACSLGNVMTNPVSSRHIGGVTYVPSGPQVSKARTALVDRFLESAGTWLLMLDSDMVFTPEDIDRLIQSADPIERPVIGALYMGTGQDLGYIDPEAGWFDESHESGYLLPRPATARGIIKVDFVGAGALLVHRAVFERVAQDYPRPQPWFQEVARNGRVEGEDYEFCRRAAASGFGIYLNADVRLGHIKPIVVRPDGLTPR